MTSGAVALDVHFLHLPLDLALIHHETVRKRFDLLTPRQKEVVGLLAEGLTNTDIALRMEITVHTVKAHRAQAMVRMESSSFADLISQLQRLAMSPAKAGSGHRPSKALRVVVVEPDKQQRHDLVQALLQRHFVATGVSGGRALDKVWAHQAIDIVILEMELGTGQEEGLHIAARLIKEHACGVIMLTAHDAAIHRLTCLKVGADACFVKPVSLDELGACLTNLARRLH